MLKILVREDRKWDGSDQGLEGEAEWRVRVSRVQVFAWKNDKVLGMDDGDAADLYS